jgi:uncharacterized protein YcbK (DUF882 family)
MGFACHARVRDATRLALRSGIVMLAGLIGLIGPAGEMRVARASGDARTLSFFHTHTKESMTITFWWDGRYDDEALARLNWFLRDWRVDAPARMDPHLFDILWDVYRESGSREPINIISAYRSPTTNAMLHRRSSAVSEHSQHMLGKAMDIRLPDVDSARLRAVAMRMQYGGVGYYQSSDFVHVDTGNVRAWPRMSQDQLARLFPDGKTVHLPPSGKPLARYEEAKAEIQARNQMLASGANVGQPLSSLVASLFGRGPATGDDKGAAGPGLGSAGEADPEAAAPVPLPPQRPTALASLSTAKSGAERFAAKQGADGSAAAEASLLLFSGEPVGKVRSPIGSAARTLPLSYLTAGVHQFSTPSGFVGTRFLGGSDGLRFSNTTNPAASFRIAQN